MAGCATKPTSAELRLQREDFIIVSTALRSLEPTVTHELVAAKRAWPWVVNGLALDRLKGARATISAAADSAAKIRTPNLLAEAQAASLTGPSALIAGLFTTYHGLVARSWALIGTAINQIEAGERARAGLSGADASERGSGASARDAQAAATFARKNVALYIEGVYDGHFDLAQVGKKLLNGYRKLGGQAAFGGTLTQGEVNALAEAYSEAAARLHPHVGVRLGS